MAESDSNSATSSSEDQQQTKNQESMNSRWGAQVAAYTDEDEMDSDDKDDELIDSAFLR